MADDDVLQPPSPRACALLRTILQRRALRVWADKSAQERAAFADDIHQLFSSPSAIGAAPTSASNAFAPRAVTRRPGVEEVKSCLRASVCARLPPQCTSLRSEIWQVLLNVYKRNTSHHHNGSSSSQDFDRMMLRLGKLPRDPLLVTECAAVSSLLVTNNDDETNRAQRQHELELLLIWFLTTKSVAYAPGMARAVAPFFLLDLPLPTIYDCFYQFCATFLPHLITAADADSDVFVITDTAETDPTAAPATAATLSPLLQSRQLLVEQLVSYHDPTLSHVLTQWSELNDWSVPGGPFVPESFFTGALYEALSPQNQLLVLDQLLVTGDALFSVFVLLAVLVNARDALLQATKPEQVRAALCEAVHAATTDAHNAAHVELLCLLASDLRRRTPWSYTCSLPDAVPSTRSATRHATDIAFHTEVADATARVAPTTTAAAATPVDMTQWVKKESRSIAGKIFWYHTQTGSTQWEHPTERFDPPPALFAVPISVAEVAPYVLASTTSSLHYFVIDCRGLRSSEDHKSGRIPAAYTLDPTVFESPDLIATNMEALGPLQSKVHIVLVGHGVGVPPALVTTDDVKTSVRDAVRMDIDALNRAALFFQKRGFRFVSVLDGGYASWHAFMRDTPTTSPHELLNHVASECHYCRYDRIVASGEDATAALSTKAKPVPVSHLFRRRKNLMPTTTDLPVNGGEGDASIGIVSTSSFATNRPSETFTRSGSSDSMNGSSSSSRLSLTLSRTSISNMRTKFADVKMPKLQWGRRSSATLSSTTAANANPNGDSASSSSETATVDDGGSDRGSSAADDESNEKQQPDEVLEDVDRLMQEGDEENDPALAALQAKLEAQAPSTKSFVGVFTIDYSDDEDADENEKDEIEKGVDDSSGTARALPASAVASPTQSA